MRQQNNKMTSTEFKAWLAEMKKADLAGSDAAAARLLGVSTTAIGRMKADGTDRRTACVCRMFMQTVDHHARHCCFPV